MLVLILIDTSGVGNYQSSGVDKILLVYCKRFLHNLPGKQWHVNYRAQHDSERF